MEGKCKVYRHVRCHQNVGRDAALLFKVLSRLLMSSRQGFFVIHHDNKADCGSITGLIVNK